MFNKVLTYLLTYLPNKSTNIILLKKTKLTHTHTHRQMTSLVA